MECTPITQLPVETQFSVTTASSTASNKKQTQEKIITVLHYLGIATFTTPGTEQNIFRPVTLGQQVANISSPTMLFLILVKTGFKQILQNKTCASVMTALRKKSGNANL
jgi:hypothetical protein